MNPSAQPSPSIIANDQPTKPDWKALIRQWQTSGLSVSQLCRENHIPEHQIYYYRKKYLGQSPTPAATDKSATHSPAGFAQVAINTSPSLPLSGGLSVHLTSGITVSGFSGADCVVRFLEALS